MRKRFIILIGIFLSLFLVWWFRFRDDENSSFKFKERTYKRDSKDTKKKKQKKISAQVVNQENERDNKINEENEEWKNYSKEFDVLNKGLVVYKGQLMRPPFKIIVRGDEVFINDVEFSCEMHLFKEPEMGKKIEERAWDIFETKFNQNPDYYRKHLNEAIKEAVEYLRSHPFVEKIEEQIKYPDGFITTDAYKVYLKSGEKISMYWSIAVESEINIGCEKLVLELLEKGTQQQELKDKIEEYFKKQDEIVKLEFYNFNPLTIRWESKWGSSLIKEFDLENVKNGNKFENEKRRTPFDSAVSQAEAIWKALSYGNIVMWTGYALAFGLSGEETEKVMKILNEPVDDTEKMIKIMRVTGENYAADELQRRIELRKKEEELLKENK